MNKTQEQEEVKQSISDKLINSRLIKSLLSGVLITLLSYIILGFNLSTNSGIKINDDINRYFDTCVGQFFTDTTPRISVEERGFPLSFAQKTNVPICNDRNQASAEVQWTSSSSFEAGAFMANVIFWSCATFVVLRSYIRRRHIKVTRSA